MLLFQIRIQGVKAMNYQSIINEIFQEISPLLERGRVADYISALAEINPNQFATILTLFDGTQFNAGEVNELFSIQSISKVFTFILALKFYRSDLYRRIGIEPSGNSFRYCAIEMNTKMLSCAMLYLANDGVDPINKVEHISESQSKRINAAMLTCGHYVVFNVGLLGKSDVDGGIVADVSNLMSISVWSPDLNENGNFLAGTKALELFTTKTGLSIFFKRVE